MPIEPCVFTDEVSPDFEEAVQLSVEAAPQDLTDATERHGGVRR